MTSSVRFHSHVVFRHPIHRDTRGHLVKTFIASEIASVLPDFSVGEVFISTSRKDVLRGMHFQGPSHGQHKIISCLEGRALDVIVDLRKESPGYGQIHEITLSADAGESILVPVGYAHGFLALEDPTILQYVGSSEYHPLCEGGIRWDSFGFVWPIKRPTVSERDQSLPSFSEFNTPF